MPRRIAIATGVGALLAIGLVALHPLLTDLAWFRANGREFLAAVLPGYVLFGEFALGASKTVLRTGGTISNAALFGLAGAWLHFSRPSSALFQIAPIALVWTAWVAVIVTVVRT